MITPILGDARKINLNSVFSSFSNPDRARHLKPHLYEIDQDLTILLARDKTTPHNPVLHRLFERSFDFVHDHNINLDEAFARSVTRMLDLKRTYEIIETENQSFFADIFTLQERIAGRSLAFEGIRLVKERIK